MSLWRRDCACGSVVVADPLDAFAGVNQHVLSEPHRSYSDRTSWAGPREVVPTAESVPCDVSTGLPVRPRRHPRARARRYFRGQIA